jgi:hypothetical protein
MNRHSLSDKLTKAIVTSESFNLSSLSRRAAIHSCAVLGVFGFAAYSRQASSSQATDVSVLSRVRFKDNDGAVQQVDGRVLFRGAEGGLLIEDAAARLWTVTAERLVSENKTSTAFEPLTAAQLGEVISNEAVSAGVNGPFSVHTTDHYVIATNTSEVYAQWCGRLLERLKVAMTNFWKTRDLELAEPEFPLPVLILSRKEDFGKLAVYDSTPGSAKGQGYYLITGNRVVLYDLTSNGGASTAKTVGDVQRRLVRSPSSVATVVHEATHQIAFNCGVHTRYADNPLWMTEGLAMYFETPDLSSSRGWRTIGKISPVRLRRFRDYAATRRDGDSLETLIRDNARLVDPEKAIDAYAESWALTHFLIRSRGRQYATYVRKLAEKPRLRFDKPDERLAAFQENFGALSIMEKQFLSYVRRLRG